MAMAERFNNAEIIATDITSVFQPGSGPPNVEFELDDAEEEWTYNDLFNFIHLRDMSGAFADWSFIYAEVYKHLTIGGSVEIADHGMIQFQNEPPNSYVKAYNGALQSAADRAGRPIGLEHLERPMIERAGLSFSRSRTFEVPLGTYPTDPVRKVAGKMAMIAGIGGSGSCEFTASDETFGLEGRGCEESVCEGSRGGDESRCTCIYSSPDCGIPEDDVMIMDMAFMMD